MTDITTDHTDQYIGFYLRNIMMSICFHAKAITYASRHLHLLPHSPLYGHIWLE